VQFCGRNVAKRHADTLPSQGRMSKWFTSRVKRTSHAPDVAINRSHVVYLDSHFPLHWLLCHMGLY